MTMFAIRERSTGQWLADYPTEHEPMLPWAFSPDRDDAADFPEWEADILAREFLPVAVDVVSLDE